MPRAKQYFLDTNVIVYAYDANDDRKRELARHLLKTHSTSLVTSTQVLIELYSACIGKLGKTPAEALEIVRLTAELAVVPADRQTIIDSAVLANQEALSIYDAAIVTAALKAECDELFTEDAEIAAADLDIPVVNPFAA